MILWLEKVFVDRYVVEKNLVDKEEWNGRIGTSDVGRAGKPISVRVYGGGGASK